MRVLIVGGSGAFGQRVSARLCQHADLDLTLAGRQIEKTRATARSLSKLSHRPIASIRLDATSVTAGDLSALRPHIIINASGPFQSSTYALAQAAIGARSHYIDLADDRRFVTGITSLNADARSQGVAVISGASSVPGLSTTVFEHLAAGFAQIKRVEIAISPGADFDPGLATTQAVLRGIGRPFPVRRAGQDQHGYGWQDLSRRRFGDLGRRWLANVEVPDLALIPNRHPDIETVTFQAGPEIWLHHLGLWALSGLVRTGVISRADRCAKALLRLRAWTKFLGSDRGGMQISITGERCDGKRDNLLWTLIATEGDGPYVPTLASTILAKAIARGDAPPPGAHPCYALFSYADFEKELSGLAISCTIERRVR